MSFNEYATVEHALAYLAMADQIPHRADGEAVLLNFVPRSARRVLDLGAGDGRLLALLRIDRPEAQGVALDFSPTMLEAAEARFGDDPLVDVMAHDLDEPLPEMGTFDVIVSSFAIHHCDDARKQSLYAEIFDLLEPGGVFMNLEHVASATPALHQRFLDAMGITAEQEDPSNKLAQVAPQLAWLRGIGFQDVDCYWKWMELALFGGFKPRQS